MVALKDLCFKLKELREENGLLQSELAKLSGVNQPTISNIEKGKNFSVEAFLSLYNFYVEKEDSNSVVSKLFNISDPYSGILVEKLKHLGEKHQIELKKLIEYLE